MIQVHVVARDYMQKVPLRGVQVRLKLGVVATWAVVERGSDEPPGGPPGPSSEPTYGWGTPHHDDEPGPPTSVSFVTSDPVYLPVVEETTGEDGALLVAFDASAAFAELRDMILDSGGRVPQVTAFIEATVSRLGLTRLFTAEGFGDDHHVDLPVYLDFAKSGVGHTTETTTRLWFCRHGAIQAGDVYTCELQRHAPPRPGFPITRAPRGPARLESLTLDAAHENTASLEIDNLIAGSHYTYALKLHAAGEPAPITLCRGGFHTADADPEQVRFVFSSCHTPAGAWGGRWQALAERTDYDFALLIGDQIYEHGLDEEQGSWVHRYNTRYHLYWTSATVRQVIQNTPTYRIWDDHEIMDGWGGEVDPDVEENNLRFAQAQLAYRTFQQPTNPDGLAAPFLDYSFRRGPVAFYVADTRSFRGRDAAFPILGEDQFIRIADWANGPEVADADVVVFVTSVPIAFVQAEEIRRLVEKAEDLAEHVGGAAGAFGGAIVGGGLGGPLGAGIGAGIGYYIGSQAAEKYAEKHLGDFDTKYDLVDHWTAEENRSDLLRVLDQLFEIASDRLPNSVGANKRAVLILGGDVHVGGMHIITSEKRNAAGDFEHNGNRHIVQVTASPISNKPPHNEFYENLLEHLQEGAGLIDLVDTALGGEDTPASFYLDGWKEVDQPATMTIDESIPGDYRADVGAVLLDRNFGHISVERLGAAGDRRYRIRLAVEGDGGWIRHDVEYDLNATEVVPIGTGDYPTITQTPSPTAARERRSRRR